MFNSSLKRNTTTPFPTWCPTKRNPGSTPSTKPKMLLRTMDDGMEGTLITKFFSLFWTKHQAADFASFFGSAINTCKYLEFVHFRFGWIRIWKMVQVKVCSDLFHTMNNLATKAPDETGVDFEIRSAGPKDLGLEKRGDSSSEIFILLYAKSLLFSTSSVYPTLFLFRNLSSKLEKKDLSSVQSLPLAIRSTV